MPRSGLMLCLALVGGCLAPDARSCSENDECRLEGREGRCEPIGYCAYPNDACDLGYSYSPYAPTELANACISEGDAQGTSKGTESTGTQSCAMGCLDVEALGQWTLEVPFELADALVRPDGTLIVGGNVAPTAYVVALEGPAVTVPDFDLVALAANADAVALGGHVEGQPTLLLTDASLQLPATLRRWTTGGQDALVGIGPGSDGGWVAGGTARGRAWVEAIEADGTTRWAHQWDGERPVRALGRGGLAYAISPSTAGVEARAFTPTGGLVGPVVLSSNVAALQGATITATGIAFASADTAVGSPHPLEPPIEVSLEAGAAASAVLDGAGNLVVVQERGGLVVETFDPTGMQLGHADLQATAVGAVHARTDATGSVVVLARVGQDQVFAWRTDG